MPKQSSRIEVGGFIQHSQILISLLALATWGVLPAWATRFSPNLLPTLDEAISAPHGAVDGKVREALKGLQSLSPSALSDAEKEQLAQRLMQILVGGASSKVKLEVLKNLVFMGPVAMRVRAKPPLWKSSASVVEYIVFEKTNRKTSPAGREWVADAAPSLWRMGLYQSIKALGESYAKAARSQHELDSPAVLELAAELVEYELRSSQAPPKQTEYGDVPKLPANLIVVAVDVSAIFRDALDRERTPIEGVPSRELLDLIRRLGPLGGRLLPKLEEIRDALRVQTQPPRSYGDLLQKRKLRLGFGTSDERYIQLTELIMSIRYRVWEKNGEPYKQALAALASKESAYPVAHQSPAVSDRGLLRVEEKGESILPTKSSTYSDILRAIGFGAR